MNLWLRLFWMLITHKLRSRATIMQSTSLFMRVLPNDLDFNGHVNNGRYFTLADIGRMDFVLRTGTAKVALKHKALPIVGDAMAKFRKDLKVFERYEMQTRVLGWDEKWVFMEHRFVRGGRVAGVVVMRGLFRTSAGVMTPAFLLQEMGISHASPALPDWLAEWNTSCDALAGALREEEGRDQALA
jgi:acyl-CoA thioesterase FadM